MENIFAPSVYHKDSILKALQVFLYMLQVFYIILLLRKKGRYCLYFNPFHTIGPFYTSWKVFETFLNMKVEIEDKKNALSTNFSCINLFHAIDLFQYPLRTSENQRFSDVLREYWKRPVAWNVLMWHWYYRISGYLYRHFILKT